MSAVPDYSASEAAAEAIISGACDSLFSNCRQITGRHALFSLIAANQAAPSLISQASGISEDDAEKTVRLFAKICSSIDEAYSFPAEERLASNIWGHISARIYGIAPDTDFISIHFLAASRNGFETLPAARILVAAKTGAAEQAGIFSFSEPAGGRKTMKPEADFIAAAAHGSGLAATNTAAAIKTGSVYPSGDNRRISIAICLEAIPEQLRPDGIAAAAFSCAETIAAEITRKTGWPAHAETPDCIEPVGWTFPELARASRALENSGLIAETSPDSAKPKKSAPRI